MSKKILIVDDEDLPIMSITKVCKDNGMTTDSAKNSGEAIDKVKSGGPYDAVIIDFNLEDIKGDELLKKLKEAGTVGKSILMSATSNMDFQSKGFDFFIEKPVKSSELKALIGKL